MTKAELFEHYRHHPLGHALKIFNETSDINVQHRMYMSAQSMILLLRWQEELSEDEKDVLVNHLEERVQVHGAGSA
ncbi:hypothetical protein C8D92_102225 [Tamilnaduibacter salinus]|uniref:Uncharacterized protein n=1 Tax=Tamilnaduibacter salinus TaxID=1484056 RepID=A0A2U1CZG3_9GAMM|nr:hypothetical protein [Tamilnaduibacter salinus]PVY78185.1 hypothetical protein C8D92_102225 [Tamilnaduibacter salinus]